MGGAKAAAQPDNDFSGGVMGGQLTASSPRCPSIAFIEKLAQRLDTPSLVTIIFRGGGWVVSLLPSAHLSPEHRTLARCGRPIGSTIAIEKGGTHGEKKGEK